MPRLYAIDPVEAVAEARPLLDAVQQASSSTRRNGPRRGPRFQEAVSTETRPSATTVASALVVLGFTLWVGCVNAARTATGDVDPGAISIVVENHSSETLDVYLSNARTSNARLGRVYGLGRLVSHVSTGLLRQETVLYSVPSNGTLGQFDHYATRPFTLDAPRDVLWVIESGERFSAVSVH